MKLSEFFADETKWKQYDTGKRGEARCFMGAIVECYTYEEILGKNLCYELSTIIQMLYPERVKNALLGLVIPRFNDHPDTTIEDIRRVCKFADR